VEGRRKIENLIEIPPPPPTTKLKSHTFVIKRIGDRDIFNAVLFFDQLKFKTVFLASR